jgi:hypothetical protein
MTERLLVVFQRGQLTAKDKERMTKAGIVAVEADDPKQVVQLHLSAPLVTTGLTGDAIVTAALTAITSQPIETSTGGITGAGRVAAKFVALLSASLNAAPKEHQ